MNEQAIIDSYNLFVQNGYKKSIEEYKQLLSSNPNALSDSYNLFQQNGYKKSLDEYKNLMGVSPIKASGQEPEIPSVLQKKNGTTESRSALGSSVSSVSAEETPDMAQFGYQPGKPLPQQIPSIQPEQPTKPKYTEEVMFGPMGISGVKTTGEAPEFIGKSIPKVIGEIGKVLAKGVVKSPASVLETVAIASAAARNLAAKTGIVDETSALDISVPIGAANVNFYQAAGEWKDLVNDFVPTDKDIESGFWGQTANALGEMIPVLLTGLISGGAKAIAKEAGKKGLSMQAVANYGKNVVSRIGTPQGVLTISQVAAPSYEQAKLEGATENEALGYAIQNAVMTFPLEMLPVNNLFKRLDNVLVGNTGVEVLKRAVIGGGEEFITEGVQAVYENVTADAIYGTTRGFLDGVGEASAVGGTVGAIMNGVLTALLGRRARATSNKEIEEIDKSIKDVEQKIAQVDSNNESLKETVKVLEEAKPRVLSYGSANYNFIESPKGDLEYADDALTEQQAQGIIGNLTNSYKKIDFKIEEVEPDDPYQPTTYKIIGKPKAIQQEAVVESGLTPIERIQQIETIELELKADDNVSKQGGNALSYLERTTLEEELQTLKAEQDAIQKQAAGQVPVQSGATVSQEVAQGEPQAEPQVTTETGAQEEVIATPLISVENTTKALQNIAKATPEKVEKILGEDIVYHGTKKDFDEFDENKIGGTDDGWYGKGFYFHSDRDRGGYGDIVKAAKIDLKNPIVLPVEDSGQYLYDIVGQEAKLDESFRDEGSQNIIREIGSDNFTKIAKKLGYDGVIVNYAQGTQEVVAFDKNSIKQSNPKTISEAYHKAKADGSNPELVQSVEKLVSPAPIKEEVTPLQTTKQDTNEAIPTERVQPELRTVQPETKTTTKPAKPKGPARVSTKREQVKSSIQRVAKAGLLRSAETGKQTITEQEIDAQMALTDAMARVWQETSGKDNFYETFFEDVKEGDIDAIRQKGGALFQSTELPQLPVTRVTLAVFELPEFQKMKGNMVAPQAVSDLMKSRGKQIEKDIINTVLSYDKYQGQKRISFDEFKDDVETQLMKLERIDTNTYASYGMDNLGDEQNYGTAQTIIFNSPIDHGQFGHFRGDFNNRAIQITTWNIRQVPNTEQYVAIDANMPAGIEQNEMAQYVGTAGPLADVQRWVNDRNSVSERNINVGLFGHIRNWFNRNTGVYTLAELQSDYFQKNKANDLYASKIPQEEIDEYMNKNFRSKLDKETRELFKKELDIETQYVLNEKGEKTGIGAFNSDGDLLGLERIETYSTAPIGYDVDEHAENRVVIEASRVLARQDSDKAVAKRFREIQDEYEVKRKELKKEEYKYIAKRVEEVKKSEAGNLMLSQFVASQKVHELRLFRESLKHAADKGATELWFPTPYTIAVIEGYVSDKGTPPYDIIRWAGDDSYLEVGDLIDYGGTRMIVVASGSYEITVVPRDSVSIYDIDDLRRDEVDNRMNELEYSLERQVSDINAITRQEAEEYDTDEWMSENINDELKSYFENNPEEETVSWNKIERDVRDRVEKEYDYMTPQDLASWAEEIYEDGDTIYTIDERRATENLGQPSEYESNVNEDDFEDQLSETQSTIVNKYGELGEMIRKMRPDAEVVRDDNNKAWIRTSITAADASNPIIAFQEEGGKIKGAIDFSNDNKASVYVFDGADISTLTHEMSGHLGRRVLEKLAETNADFAKDYETAKKWAGVENNQWTRGAEEKWARGFEKYLRSGKAPSNALKNVFEKLKDWLTNIYKTIKGSSIDIKLTPSITSVFDNLLATKQEQGKEVDVLEDAFDFLDKIDKGISKTLKTRANDALLGIPLTAIQGMVKGLKALVQGGMKLRDAIKNIAAENNISQEKLRDILDIASIQEDFNTLMTKADKLIATQKSKEIPEKKIVSNLDTMVRKFYQDMDLTDAQRKIMESEARARMGVEPRKAASIGRVIGVLKDITNVTREEKLKIISRIRELGRDVAKDLTSEIREMVKGGTITANQSADIIARFGKINMLNEKSVSNFVDYMAKVFANAEYNSQLKDALSTRKRLRSLSKNKEKAANLKSIASKFVEIDPTMVEDIYEYNRLAKMIEESVAGSSIRGKDVKFANIIQEGDVIPYINKTLDAQNKTLFEEKLKEVQDILSEIQDILGVDAKDLSYEDLLAIISDATAKGKGKDNEKLVRDAINKAFDVYSSVIKSIIKTGVDPFTGQDVKYTDAQKKIISDFMDMDLNIIPAKQALEAVDAALNFLQNKSTAKMESIFRGYMGEKNARELVNKGVKASPLRKYFSKGLGRFFGEQTTNLGLLFERLFKGFEAGGMVQDAMGLTDLINGKSQAQNESNRIINDYVNEFYKKKANGEVFNTESNNVERGMVAFLMRNVIGTEAEIKAEFKRRKNLIKESIEELGNGNEKEVAKSLIYQDVYDKILKDANNFDDVSSKVDAVNLEAVKFWQDQWQNKYDELADVSLNVYNKILEKDTDYTPDKYGRLSTSSEAVEITENDMAFNVNNGTLYKKETGVLMEATRPTALPVDNTTGEVNRYIDLSFDSNNANSMYDALVDIKTAGPIRQVQAFLNSKSFKKIFPQAEDATILKGDGRSKRIGRIELFTRNFRNKNPYSEDEFSAAVRNLNRLANVGVSQALGGVFQPIKQVIPVGMNTLINGGGLDIDAMTNPAKIKFMMDSGYAIGFRGVESQAQVESLNKLMDMATKSRGEKAMKYIEEANKIWLKIFLVKPDVFIARASWMTYYEQSLKKQGIDTKDIDYNTHKLNEKAANYAQRMVDRQQNVSDADLSGKLFAEKNPSKQMMMKVFMPFASFRMNQSARIGADIATITSKVSTEEDRAIAARSLAGFTVEMVTFRALSLGISLLTTSVVASMMGSDEEDEEKKKNSIIKGQATNTISDVLSPIPFADPFVQAIAATTLQGAQDIAGVEEEDALSIYSPQDKGYIEQLGLFGFAAQRVIQTGDLVWLSSVGTYRDNYGKKKYISDDDKEALRLLIGPALLTNIGLAPSEMNSVVRASMSAAKKNSSTKEGGSTAGKDYESEMIDRIEEDLLEGYENKSDMKRYNPRLYEQNFGEGSEYYELTKEKRAEEKKAREEEQKEKDAEYGYRGKSKGFGSRSKSSGKGFGSKGFGKD